MLNLNIGFLNRSIGNVDLIYCFEPLILIPHLSYKHRIPYHQIILVQFGLRPIKHVSAPKSLLFLLISCFQSCFHPIFHLIHTSSLFLLQAIWTMISSWTLLTVLVCVQEKHWNLSTPQKTTKFCDRWKFALFLQGQALFLLKLSISFLYISHLANSIHIDR